MNLEKKILAFGIVAAAIALVLNAVDQDWLLVAIMAILIAVMARGLAKDTRKENAILDELDAYMHVDFDVAQVRDYRREHPGATMAESILAVKKRNDPGR